MLAELRLVTFHYQMWTYYHLRTDIMIIYALTSVMTYQLIYDYGIGHWSPPPNSAAPSPYAIFLPKYNRNVLNCMIRSYQCLQNENPLKCCKVRRFVSFFSACVRWSIMHQQHALDFICSTCCLKQQHSLVCTRRALRRLLG